MVRLFAQQAVLVFFVGAAAHFLFDVLGRWAPVGWLAPVNESLWEHLKMAFWPTLIIDGWFNRSLPSIRFRIVCTAMSAWISTFLIAPLFYGYTDILGHHHLAADIGVFAVAVVSGHWVAYRIASGPEPSTVSVLAAGMLAILPATALIAFTYVPPPMEVFRDSLTGKYGL